MKINRTCCFEEFEKALRRKERPRRISFYEHIASPGFMKEAQALMGIDTSDPYKAYVDFWIGMGFDTVPLEISFDCPRPEGHNALSEGSEALVCIRTMEDFEKYPWPDPDKCVPFEEYEKYAAYLPEGAKLTCGVCAGPYEWVSTMMGTIGLSYAIIDAPELVDAMFAKFGDMYPRAVKCLAEMPFVGALRQGDDLGFKSSTFLSPEQLRKWVFPIYKNMVREAHAKNKPFILHSCGNLKEVYDDLIDGVGIDAKHSFEDTILPVSEFKKKYGGRVTPLGGLDVDFICRGSEEEIRAYTRKNIDMCWYDGFWTCGTGNSLTDYMPVRNYFYVLDEAIKYTS
ncbi:MAG: hypothetical protein ILO36_09275 [Abditibacteriota bacterium]|nr:hypothetical protein [Abditibacteriota bacterium]